MKLDISNWRIADIYLGGMIVVLAQPYIGNHILFWKNKQFKKFIENKFNTL